jgi:hypothetical protein
MVIYSCRILIYSELTRQISEKHSNSKVIKTCPVIAAVLHTDGRTDRQTDRRMDEHRDLTEIVDAFRNI